MQAKLTQQGKAGWGAERGSLLSLLKMSEGYRKILVYLGSLLYLAF